MEQRGGVVGGKKGGQGESTTPALWGMVALRLHGKTDLFGRCGLKELHQKRVNSEESNGKLGKKSKPTQNHKRVWVGFWGDVFSQLDSWGFFWGCGVGCFSCFGFVQL